MDGRRRRVAEMKVIGDDLTAAWIAETNGKGLDDAAMVKDAPELVAKYAN